MPVSPTLSALGVRPIINAAGIYTDLGGSRLSPAVWAAMTESNRHFVRMDELLESSGRVLAERLGAEAGQVTPGAAASITLMVAAAMTGTDGAASERLPQVTGLHHEILLQHNHRYQYARQIPLTGARVMYAGTDAGTTIAELVAAITPRLAAVLVPAHLDGHAGTVPLARVVELAHRVGVPVIVDAAYLCWPLDALAGCVATGADLVCASAKYFGGPNAGGFIVGTRAMIDAVTINNFTRYESGAHRTFGRPLKLDRQTIVGVVAAFEEWHAMDHDARWARYARQVDALGEAIAGTPGIRISRGGFTMAEQIVAGPVNALVIEFDPAGPLMPAAAGAALAAGEPAVAAIVTATGLVLCMDVMADAEIVPLAGRLRTVLRHPPPAP